MADTDRQTDVGNDARGKKPIGVLHIHDCPPPR